MAQLYRSRKGSSLPVGTLMWARDRGDAIVLGFAGSHGLNGKQERHHVQFSQEQWAELVAAMSGSGEWEKPR